MKVLISNSGSKLVTDKNTMEKEFRQTGVEIFIVVWEILKSMIDCMYHAWKTTQHVRQRGIEWISSMEER